MVIPAVLRLLNDAIVAIAFATESWNNATIIHGVDVTVTKTLTSIRSLLFAFVGVIANVINSVPSVFCGIVSSNGMVVVPVATAPVWVLTTCATCPLHPDEVFTTPYTRIVPLMLPEAMRKRIAFAADVETHADAPCR